MLGPFFRGIVDDDADDDDDDDDDGGGGGAGLLPALELELELVEAVDFDIILLFTRPRRPLK